MQVGLIGLGMVAGTHLCAMQAAPGVRLARVAARDADKVAAFVRRASEGQDVPPLGSVDIDAIAEDPAIDFVILTTPPDARSAIVERLVESGKPILMEKPVERTLAAARGLVDRCESAGVPLGIVLQQRTQPAIAHLRTLLAANTLGPIGLVEIRVPWWREQAYYDEPGRGTRARDGGGVLISQAIHTLDLVLSLAGPVTQVQAMANTTMLHRMETEDHVTAGLRFASGAVGSLVASTACFPGGSETITLHGTDASATFGSGRVRTVFRDGRESVFDAEPESGSGGGADPMAFTHTWHQAVIEDFAASLVEQRAPLVSGRDALAVHELIDALMRSSTEGHLTEIDTP